MSYVERGPFPEGGKDGEAEGHGCGDGQGEADGVVQVDQLQ